VGSANVRFVPVAQEASGILSRPANLAREIEHDGADSLTTSGRHDPLLGPWVAFSFLRGVKARAHQHSICAQ